MTLMWRWSCSSVGSHVGSHGLVTDRGKLVRGTLYLSSEVSVRSELTVHVKLTCSRVFCEVAWIAGYGFWLYASICSIAGCKIAVATCML